MVKNEPKRMCVACREMKDKRDLIRVVKNAENGIAIDVSFKSSGRGAYVCKCADCIKRLKKYKLLNKAFSSLVSEDVYADIEAIVQNEIAQDGRS